MLSHGRARMAHGASDAGTFIPFPLSLSPAAAAPPFHLRLRVHRRRFERPVPYPMRVQRKEHDTGLAPRTPLRRPRVHERPCVCYVCGVFLAPSSVALPSHVAAVAVCLQCGAEDRTEQGQKRAEHTKGEGGRGGTHGEEHARRTELCSVCMWVRSVWLSVLRACLWAGVCPLPLLTHPTHAAPRRLHLQRGAFVTRISHHCTTTRSNAPVLPLVSACSVFA
jgi:hypothetical protein